MSRASFVVRVVEDCSGQVSGVIERVATGAKEAFSGLEGIGRVIGTMLLDASPSQPAGPPLPPSPGDPGCVPGPARSKAESR